MSKWVELWEDTIGDSGEAPTDPEIKQFALAVRNVVFKEIVDRVSDPGLDDLRKRYSKALDAKPSKGPILEEGIVALQDSVADIPSLVYVIEDQAHEIESLRNSLDRLRGVW